MDIKARKILSLSADDIRQIIVEYLSKEGYNIKPNNINFKISEECHGYGMGEYYKTVFSGCSVNCNEG